MGQHAEPASKTNAEVPSQDTAITDEFKQVSTPPPRLALVSNTPPRPGKRKNAQQITAHVTPAFFRHVKATANRAQMAKNDTERLIQRLIQFIQLGEKDANYDVADPKPVSSLVQKSLAINETPENLRDLCRGRIFNNDIGTLKRIIQTMNQHNTKFCKYYPGEKFALCEKDAIDDKISSPANKTGFRAYVLYFTGPRNSRHEVQIVHEGMKEVMDLTHPIHKLCRDMDIRRNNLEGELPEHDKGIIDRLNKLRKELSDTRAEQIGLNTFVSSYAGYEQNIVNDIIEGRISLREYYAEQLAGILKDVCPRGRDTDWTLLYTVIDFQNMDSQTLQAQPS